MPITCENGIWKTEIVPLPDDWPEFRNILLNRLKKYPTRVSQIDAITDRKDTYAQLADRVVRCSLWLKKQNLKADDIIGICSYRHLDTIVPLVASLLAGVIVHPWWDATLTDDTIKYFLNLTKPKIIFADEMKAVKIRKIVDEVGATVKIIAFNDAPDFETFNYIMKSQTAEKVTHFQCEQLHDPNQSALMLCTSGSTGYPKGVLRSYGWLIDSLAPISENPDINYWTSGINWISGLTNTLLNIYECSTAIIHPNPNEEIILKMIEKYKIMGLLFLNTGYAIRMCASDMVKNYDVSSVKRLEIGGSTLDPKVDKYMAESFQNAHVMHGYGCTEIGCMCLRPRWTGKPTSCGLPTKNVEIKVIDLNNEKVLGSNQEGEICIKHPYSMRSYYNNPKAALDEDGWYHTEDIGCYDEDGEFFIVDRMKDVIKFRVSYYYPPSAIEKVIRKYPGVIEVAVVAKPHVEDVEQPMAFVSTLPNTKISEQDIIDFVAQNLPDHMHLRGGVIILDQLPHTESGKIAKIQLKTMITPHDPSYH